MVTNEKPTLPLRWGLISTARINQALIPPLRNSERNELLGVASRSMVKAQDYTAEWEIPNAYGSYQALLDDADIDVVYNSLPNHLHAEWTVKALESDKHVLCEKPLAISLQEVDQMRAAAANHERVLTEAFMYRHHPQTILVKEMVDSGEIGEVRVIKGAFSYNLTNSGDVRLKPEMGGGSLWDVGCYPVSYARYILGHEPLEAFGWGTFGESGVDEVFIGQLRFVDDVFVQFDCGFRSLPRSRIVIIGSRATLTVPTPFKPGTDEVIKLFRDDQLETLEVPGQELYIGEVEDMTDAILSGKQPRISLEDSRNNVAVILALLQSAQEGRSVSLD
jgi:predicted dehydrogenase